MNEVALVIGMALVTFAVRYPVLLLVSRIPLPEALFRALRYVPPAVLAAIIAPAVLIPRNIILRNTNDLSPDNSYLVAGLVCVIVAWRTRHLLFTIILGMAAMLGWRALTGQL